MNAKRFSILTVSITATALAVVALFNVLVDPFGVYPRVHLKAFEHLRASVFTRQARAEMARRGDWDMMIFGTSRPKAGLPWRHAAYGTNRICNMSADAAYMTEAAKMFDYARARNPLRRVVLCLDFAISRRSLIDKSDFAQSRFNPELSLFDYHCKNLIGAAASGESLEFAIAHVRRAFPPAQQRDGFFVHALKPGASQREVFGKNIRKLAYGYAVQRPANEEMAAFRHMLMACRENKIEITLAINPVHALDLELLRAVDNWNRFEAWKRDVVHIIEEVAPDDSIPLWDFTGYWAATEEEVPPEGDTTSRMKYYYENSHFTPAMGTLMLDRMFGGVTNEFGVKISTANIEAHLQRIREQREAYARQHQDEIQWVERISRQALAGRKSTAALAEELE